jgi:hypothetical protein
VKHLLVNQKGFSLIQVMVSGALMVALGGLWATHMKNNLRDEKRLEMKTEIRQLENLLTEVLNDNAAAFWNFGEAFRNTPINLPETTYSGTVGELRTAPVRRDGQWFRGRVVLRENHSFGSRMIHVQGINFILSNVVANEGGDGGSHRGNVTIRLELRYCADGGQYRRYLTTPTGLSSANFAIAPLCTPVIREVVKQGVVVFNVFPGPDRAGQLLENPI